MRTSAPWTVSPARCVRLFSSESFQAILSRKSGIQSTIKLWNKLNVCRVWCYTNPNTAWLKSSKSLTTTVLVTYVRKPPNISQIHRKANDRQEKIHLFAPFVPGVRLCDDRHRDSVVGGVAGVRGAVVGQTAGHDRWVLSGHRTVKSQSEEQLHREEAASPITMTGPSGRSWWSCGTHLGTLPVSEEELWFLLTEPFSTSSTKKLHLKLNRLCYSFSITWMSSVCVWSLCSLT